MSCGAACWRQLLLEEGVVIDEATLRSEAGFDATFGIVLDDLRDAMNQRSPSHSYLGGTMDEMAKVTSIQPPFIVVMKKHFLIVDALDGNTVTLRDPAPAPGVDHCGSEVTMARSDFDRDWKGGIIFSRNQP